jgi:hypothetical protein
MQTKYITYFLLVSFFGCGAVKDFSKKSDKMLKTSKKLHGLSQQSTKNLCHAFIQGRQGNSSLSRNENIELLKGKDTDLGDKIKVASKFVQGLEFQLYAGNCDEVPVDRQELIKSSISEFIKVMSGPFEQQDAKISALDYTKGNKNHNEQIMAAMALSLHVTNRIQDENAKKLNFPVITLWQIISDALVRHHQGEKPRFYEEELLVHSNYNMMTQLLEYRAEMLLTLSLKEMIETTDANFMGQVGMILTKQPGAENIKLESKYLKRNEITQKKINSYLQGAFVVLSLAKKINYQMKIDHNLIEIYNRLDLKNDETKASESSEILATNQNKNSANYQAYSVTLDALRKSF